MLVDLLAGFSQQLVAALERGPLLTNGRAVLRQLEELVWSQPDLAR